MVDVGDIGRLLPEIRATVERGRLRAFLRLIGERDPIYHDDAAARGAGFRATPVPPTYLFCLEMMEAENPFGFIEDLGIAVDSILHGEQRFVYRAPACVGDTLVFRPRVSLVEHKKGGAMTLMMQETAVTTGDGTPVADLSRTIFVRNRKDVR